MGAASPDARPGRPRRCEAAAVARCTAVRQPRLAGPRGQGTSRGCRGCVRLGGAVWVCGCQGQPLSSACCCCAPPHLTPPCAASLPPASAPRSPGPQRHLFGAVPPPPPPTLFPLLSLSSPLAAHHSCFPPPAHPGATGPCWPAPPHPQLPSLLPPPATFAIYHGGKSGGRPCPSVPAHALANRPRRARRPLLDSRRPRGRRRAVAATPPWVPGHRPRGPLARDGVAATGG